MPERPYGTPLKYGRKQVTVVLHPFVWFEERALPRFNLITSPKELISIELQHLIRKRTTVGKY